MMKRKGNIDGIGSIGSGEYDQIKIDGIGKIKGDVSAASVNADGMLKIKGRVLTDELNIDGIARCFRDIKTKKADIDGILKMRRSSLDAGELRCDGAIICTREINADSVTVHGMCSVKRIYGDRIELLHESKSSEKESQKTILRLGRLYFGRKISVDHNIVDEIECTSLTAENLKAKIIRSGEVTLSKGCVIDRLYCEGKITVDKSCVIKQILSEDGKITREEEKVADKKLTMVLDSYKEGRIDADEAEKLIGAIMPGTRNEEDTDHWADDGKLRIIAYIGRKILKKGDKENEKLTVEYTGEALGVETALNLICGDVNGNAHAGLSIACGDIGGNAASGTSISCGEIKGNAQAGTGVKIIRERE